MPDFDKMRISLNDDFEQQRTKEKKEGMKPRSSFEYKPFIVNASGEIFSEYVPPEGDGKKTILSVEVKKNIPTIQKI